MGAGKKVRGVIESISRKEKEGQHGTFTAIGIKIDNAWWNGIEKKDWDPCKEGDEVLLETEENDKGYVNIVSLTNLSASGVAQKPPKQGQIKDFSTANALPPQEERKPLVDWEAKDRRIVRQNALTQANSFYMGKPASPKDIFAFAEECEKWVYGEGQYREKKPEPKADKPIAGAQDTIGAFAQDEGKKRQKP